MKMKSMRVLAVTVALLAVASPAWAHVTVSTDNPEPGGFAVYTVRVPNESESASTVRIEVEIPDGLQASRYEPKGDWKLSLEEGVFVVDGGVIAPGEFEEFRFQARNPDTASTLAFPAIQTYDDGEVVNWTGAEGSDTPASIVDLGAAASAESPGPDVWTVVALALGAVGVIMGGAALVRRRG